MTGPIKISELQQLAEMHRNGLALDRDQEAKAFAGLDALLDLAIAVLPEYELLDEPSEELEQAMGAIDFTPSLDTQRALE